MQEPSSIEEISKNPPHTRSQLPLFQQIKTIIKNQLGLNFLPWGGTYDEKTLKKNQEENAKKIAFLFNATKGSSSIAAGALAAILQEIRKDDAIDSFTNAKFIEDMLDANVASALYGEFDSKDYSECRETVSPESRWRLRFVQRWMWGDKYSEQILKINTDPIFSKIDIVVINHILNIFIKPVQFDIIWLKEGEFSDDKATAWHKTNPPGRSILFVATLQKRWTVYTINAKGQTEYEEIPDNSPLDEILCKTTEENKDKHKELIIKRFREQAFFSKVIEPDTIDMLSDLADLYLNLVMQRAESKALQILPRNLKGPLTKYFYLLCQKLNIDPAKIPDRISEIEPKAYGTLLNLFFLMTDIRFLGLLAKKHKEEITDLLKSWEKLSSFLFKNDQLRRALLFILWDPLFTQFITSKSGIDTPEYSANVQSNLKAVITKIWGIYTKNRLIWSSSRDINSTEALAVFLQKHKNNNSNPFIKNLKHIEKNRKKLKPDEIIAIIKELVQTENEKLNKELSLLTDMEKLLEEKQNKFPSPEILKKMLELLDNFFNVMIASKGKKLNNNPDFVSLVNSFAEILPQANSSKYNYDSKAVLNKSKDLLGSAELKKMTTLAGHLNRLLYFLPNKIITWGIETFLKIPEIKSYLNEDIKTQISAFGNLPDVLYVNILRDFFHSNSLQNKIPAFLKSKFLKFIDNFFNPQSEIYDELTKAIYSLTLFSPGESEKISDKINFLLEIETLLKSKDFQNEWKDEKNKELINLILELKTPNLDSIHIVVFAKLRKYFKSFNSYHREMLSDLIESLLDMTLSYPSKSAVLTIKGEKFEIYEEYELVLMSPEIEMGKIYVDKVEKDKLRYTLKRSTGDISAVITAQELSELTNVKFPLKDNPDELKKLKLLSPFILNIASNKGHTLVRRRMLNFFQDKMTKKGIENRKYQETVPNFLFGLVDPDLLKKIDKERAQVKINKEWNQFYQSHIQHILIQQTKLIDTERSKEEQIVYILSLMVEEDDGDGIEKILKEQDPSIIAEILSASSNSFTSILELAVRLRRTSAIASIISIIANNKELFNYHQMIGDDLFQDMVACGLDTKTQENLLNMGFSIELRALTRKNSPLPPSSNTFQTLNTILAEPKKRISVVANESKTTEVMKWFNMQLENLNSSYQRDPIRLCEMLLVFKEAHPAEYEKIKSLAEEKLNTFDISQFNLNQKNDWYGCLKKLDIGETIQNFSKEEKTGIFEPM